MSSIRWTGLFLLALMVGLLPGTLAGQEAEKCLHPPVGFGSGQPGTYVSSSGSLCSGLISPAAVPDQPQAMAEQIPNPGRVFFLSAILPGLGQRTLGLDRWAGYVAAEGWAWAQFIARRREARNLQRKYRDLAWLVARRVSSGRRVDGGFEYYEALTQYNASGAYDTDPERAGIQPEEDPDTYNGTIWALSREIFFLDDPEAPVAEDSDLYVRALKYYISRAYTPDLAWNWSSNTLQQAEFAGLIRSSDEDLRRSTTMVGIILANHLLSAVDALVSARLGQVEEREPSVTLSMIPGPFYRDSFVLAVRIPFP